MTSSLIPSARDVFSVQQSVLTARSEYDARLARIQNSMTSDQEAAEIYQEVMVPVIERSLRVQQQIGGRVYRIPRDQLAPLTKKINQIARKARKLGTTAITMQTTRETENVEIGMANGWRAASEYRYVVVSGKTPMLEGWLFLATIGHKLAAHNHEPRLVYEHGRKKRVWDERPETCRRCRKEYDNFFYKTPQWLNLTEEHPEVDADAIVEPYRSRGRVCDHCGWKRERNHTYIVHNPETGQTRQVGSTCLGDFTGINDPQAAAAMLAGYFTFQADLEEAENFRPAGDREPAAFFLEDWLAQVIREIRLNGYVSAKDGYAGQNSTTRVAQDHWLGLLKTNRMLIDEDDLPCDEDQERARKVIEWVRNFTPTTPYETDVTRLFANNTLRKWNFPLAASAVPFVARKTKDRENAQQSEWYGQVKDRITLDLTVQRRHQFDGDYGKTTVYNMVDDQGHKFVWFTTANHDLQQDSRYTLTGIVKRHDTDRRTGEKVTGLTRCKVS